MRVERGKHPQTNKFTMRALEAGGTDVSPVGLDPALSINLGQPCWLSESLPPILLLTNAPGQRGPSHEANCCPWRSTAPEARQTCDRLDPIAQAAAAEAVSLHARGGAVAEEDTRDPG